MKDKGEGGEAGVASDSSTCSYRFTHHSAPGEGCRSLTVAGHFLLARGVRYWGVEKHLDRYMYRTG